MMNEAYIRESLGAAMSEVAWYMARNERAGVSDELGRQWDEWQAEHSALLEQTVSCIADGEPVVNAMQSYESHLFGLTSRATRAIAEVDLDDAWFFAQSVMPVSRAVAHLRIASNMTALDVIWEWIDAPEPLHSDEDLMVVLHDVFETILKRWGTMRPLGNAQRALLSQWSIQAIARGGNSGSTDVPGHN